MAFNDKFKYRNIDEIYLCYSEKYDIHFLTIYDKSEVSTHWRKPKFNTDYRISDINEKLKCYNLVTDNVEMCTFL